MKRRLTTLAVTALLLVSAIVAASAPSGAQDGDGRAYALGDGQWRAVFFIRTDVELGGVDFNYNGHGSAIIDMSGGEAQGEWNMSLRTVVVGESASANAVATGTVTGDGLVQDLALDQVTATDAQFGIEITMTADDFALQGIDSGAGSLVMLGRSCNAATAAWQIPFNGTTLGGDAIIEPLRPGSVDSQADLREEGLELIEQARVGNVDPSALGSYVARAESQMNGTLRRDDCLPEDAAVFAHAGAVLLATVLTETGYALGDASDEEFLDLFTIAVRSGVFLVSGDAQLRWEFEFLNRASGVLGSEDLEDLRFWQAASQQFGYDDSADALAREICRLEGGGEECDE